MERLTIPAEKLPDGRTRIQVVDSRAVAENAMEFYWRLKAYEDTGLTPEQVAALKQELVDERYRHDRLQDFEVDESQELAALKEKCRWIPVTERLPDKMGKYLCRYVFGENEEYPFEQVLWYYTAVEKPHFQNEGGMGLRVTHWMPLPEPPKEALE